MKVDLKKLPKSQVELTITVPYEIYIKAEKQALEALSKEMKIDGFRSGHIPEDVIREKAGSEAVTGAALEFVLPQTYAEAVKEQKLQVIDRPHVEIKKSVIKKGDELVYTATIAVMPEVKIGNYKKVKVTKKEAKVEKKNIDETTQMILDRYAEWKEAKRKAKKGDRVTVDFEGFDEKDQIIQGTASKSHPIILGSQMMVPGFEDALIGIEPGETKEFEVTFPKDYHAESIQGKKVKFKASVSRIEEKTEQKLDEAFIEKITGQQKSIKDFEKLIENDLKREMQLRTDQEHFDSVVTEILKITKAELPDALVAQELDLMLQEQKNRVQQQGLTWEQYLKHTKKSEEDLKKEIQKPAEERLLARLGVSEIIKDAGIEVEDKNVQEKVDELISQYPEDKKPTVRQYYNKGSEAYNNLKYKLAVDKLIEMLTG